METFKTKSNWLQEYEHVERSREARYFVPIQLRERCLVSADGVLTVLSNEYRLYVHSNACDRSDEEEGDSSQEEDLSHFRLDNLPEDPFGECLGTV